MTPPSPPSPWPPALAHVRRLVLAHGWNATAYQIVNPGIRHWFSADGEAVVGYVRRGRTRVTAGAPVCAADRLAAVVDEFERASEAAGDTVCYFGAEARLAGLLGGGTRYARLTLGVQPAWHPREFLDGFGRRASLRSQLARARKKGAAVDEWAPARAHESAALRRVLNEWLATRGLPTLHFLVEPDTLGRLDDRRVFVASRAGAAVGFVVASPVRAREGWLIEQFVRGRGATNGTMELLLHETVRAMADDGARYVTLGLAPFARRTPPDLHAPVWLRALVPLVRAHGRRFYNFGGLEAFKGKFAPTTWDPVYAFARGRRFPARALWAIAGAFGGRSPVALVAHAIGRAALQEVRWLWGHAAGD